MIVTCESCKSRYKLDDAKITGRGAKITCPKCKAVFVVYAKEQGEVSRPNLAGTPPVATPPASGGLADVVKAAERKASAAPPPPSPPAADDWEDEPTRVRDDREGHEIAPTARPSGPTAAATKPSQTPAEVAARAATLDFRSVGVTTWKVKVKIGLIYDFSDIKTLRKYIQDGRVTATDVVSWDGKTWRAIGDIPDLDAFFVETWEMLAARKEDPSSTTLSPQPPTPEVQKAIEESSGGKSGEPTQFRDPFADQRKKQQERAEAKRSAPVPPPRPEPVAERNSRLPLFAVALLLVLGLVFGTMWWMEQQGGPGPGAQTTPANTPPASADSKDVLKEINGELEAAMRANQGTGTPSPLPADNAGTGRPPPSQQEELTPVNRPGVPPGSVAVKRPGGTTNPTSSMSQQDASASDHEQVGDSEAASGNWADAAAAYQKAVSLGGKNAQLYAKLGRAQAKAGDGAAAATLQRAGQMGANEAWKWLGDLAADNGDAAGAIGHYTQYLKTRPRDAGEVQAKITQLSGG